MKSGYDAAIVGCGIVGASIAWRLSRAGLRVGCFDQSISLGATGAGMGHVAVMDDSPVQMELCLRSRQLWEEISAEMGEKSSERLSCGATWLAQDDEELAECYAKAERYQDQGVKAEAMDAAQLRDFEPNLAHSILGACHVPGDWVVFQPKATGWFLSQAMNHGAEIHLDQMVLSAQQGRLKTDKGEWEADWLIVCPGAKTELLPDWVPIIPRKGHLAITSKNLNLSRSQVIEMGYMKSAHGDSSESVAFNIQPRPGGQYLIGSSRQFGEESRGCNPHILEQVLAGAARLLPKSTEAPVLRVWTGFRPSSPDHLPIIGPNPSDPTTLIATGHEGLGITTSTATAELIERHIAAGQAIRKELLPERFLHQEVKA